MHIPRPIRSPITYSPEDESVSPSSLPARKAYRPEVSALRAGSLVEACPPWRVATVADNAVRTREPCGFTLVELIVVIALISTLMVLVAPAFTGIKSAGDVTSAAYTIKDALEQARTHAMAYKTYVWIRSEERRVGKEC